MDQCINPSEMQEGDWSAYLHGDASPGVVQHVSHCAFCARQIEEMRTVDVRLLASFYRDQCPAPDILAEYALGYLTGAEKLRIAAHVRTCPACQEELAPLGALGDEPPSLLARLWESLATALVARPVVPAAVPVRGTGWAGRFEAENLIVTLSSQNGGLTGRVRRREAAPDTDYHGQAWLLDKEREEGQPPSSEIDPQGRFQFLDVASGSYALLLQIGEQDVALEAIRVT